MARILGVERNTVGRWLRQYVTDHRSARRGAVPGRACDSGAFELVPNQAPDAQDDTATVAEDSGATTIDVLANDSIAPDTDETLTIVEVTQGTNGGTVTITDN